MCQHRLADSSRNTYSIQERCACEQTRKTRDRTQHAVVRVADFHPCNWVSVRFGKNVTSNDAKTMKPT